MKTKIGEKSKKEKISGVGGWLKAYPGAALLVALALVGGVGCAVANMPESEEQVPENTPVVEQPQEETKEPEKQEEVVAKTTDEVSEEIVAAGAESVSFTSAEEGLTVDIVLKAEATEEDVTVVNDAVKALLADTAFVKANLFENAEETANKAYTINYILGAPEGEEEAKAAYITTAGYYASEGRKGWLYTCNAAWSGPEAVEVEEEDVPVANATPDAAAPSTTTSTTTTENAAASTTENNTTNNQQQATTPTTQNQIESIEPEEIVDDGSLRSKAKKAHSKNSDVIGWLYIPGTNISEPVTHTNNNSYYMTYNVNHQKETIAGKPSWLRGALIADYECNFNAGLPTNTIIYGHNWNNVNGNLVDNNPNDKMFAEVHKYADANFAASHPTIKFSTTQRDYTYKVFAAFYTHQNWTDYIYAYPDAQKFANVISTAKSKSLHNFGVNVSTNDKIITLSTCTRMMGATDQYRFVVMAKLVG